MINTTLNDIIFNCDEKHLDSAVREGLQKTALGLLEFYNLSEADLCRISTKTESNALYSKFVLQNILANKSIIFDETYVKNAFRLYQQRNSDDAKKLVYCFLGTEESQLAFRTGYQRSLPIGIGIFLVAMHCAGAITLPLSFGWPKPLNSFGKNWVDPGKPFASELLYFFRSIEVQNSHIPDPAFSAVGTGRKRREWFCCYGTKLLIATGWHTPIDVNIEDFSKLRAAMAFNGTSDAIGFPFALFVDVLWRKYGDEILLSPKLYKESIKTDGWSKRALTLENNKQITNENSSSLATLSSVMSHEASDAFQCH